MALSSHTFINSLKNIGLSWGETSSFTFAMFNPNLGRLFRGSFWELSWQLQIWHVSTHPCVVSENIPFYQGPLNSADVSIFCKKSVFFGQYSTFTQRNSVKVVLEVFSSQINTSLSFKRLCQCIKNYHVIANQNQHNCHYKTIKSYKRNESLKSSRVKVIERWV